MMKRARGLDLTIIPKHLSLSTAHAFTALPSLLFLPEAISGLLHEDRASTSFITPKY